MNTTFKYLSFYLLLLSFALTRGSNTTDGFISGKILLDDNWEKRVFISLLETIENKYAVSNDMIFAHSEIDSLGRFRISLEHLPDHWALVRIHVVKKGDSRASLIIGSKDENHYFIVANNRSKITLNTTKALPVFSQTSLAGASYMRSFEYIDKLADYPNTLDHENSMIEKEFIDQVVRQKLKVLADTCTNPLISLYALYQFDFKSDLEAHPEYYRSFLEEKATNSSYFIPMKSQIPDVTSRLWLYIILVLAILCIIYLIYFFKGKKRRLLKSLSVQERKIFELIRTGATNQEIATRCHIEVSTVKSHVSNIYAKLKVRSRKEAINLPV